MASDWERAGAVVDRLWAAHPEGTIYSAHHNDDTITVCYYWSPQADALCGHAGTYVAALIDLGTKLDAGTETERQERED